VTTYLLDVNVLIALIDPTHVEHDRVHDWFGQAGHTSFATCPITENGLIRIVGHPKYPNSPGPPSQVMLSLNAIRQLPGHTFWPDSISIADSALIAPLQLSSHGRVTDAYLLALAHSHGGRLATLDHKLASEVVPDGKNSLELL
jgi:toxin-antitoxin system PIN domain toxin